MIGSTPLEAYAICYGPLVITVLGFILFAIMTDGDSRRTYLRVLPGRKPQPVNKAVHAETPANIPVTILPNDRQMPESEAPVIEPPAPPAPPPKPVETVVEEAAEEAEPEAEPEEVAEEPEADDLLQLEGVGPKMAQALIDAGLGTYENLAAASMDDLRAALTDAGMSFAPAAESWAEQASFAAKGDWDGLNELQSRLISGRYPPSEQS